MYTGSGSGGRGLRIAALRGRWFIRHVRVLYVLNKNFPIIN